MKPKTREMTEEHRNTSFQNINVTFYRGTAIVPGPL
jgi:hypothetical protein